MEEKVIQTDIYAKDGQNKCPKCGATDISQNPTTGKLRCNFCRYEFDPGVTHSINDDIATLFGEEIGAGIKNIDNDFNGTVTLACESCGAEVVIDTDETMSARCHWCRNTLSINKQIPNGSVPDAILPFQTRKDDARATIEAFVGKRRFFAHPKFVKEFTTENIMGVYFPYMTVDINAHATLEGSGEEHVRSYRVKRGKNYVTRYDANLYKVARDFDIMINDLTIESNSDRLFNKSGVKTNNIINAVMPFDIKNCVSWDANYLKGFSSEKRNVNIDHVRHLVDEQAHDVARFKANDTLSKYDRGVKWDKENLEIKGQRWHAVYLPIWLYSYQEMKGKQHSLMHYVAVNARTNEVMGSVPLHVPKLVFVSLIVQFFGTILAILTINDETPANFIFLLSGLLYFLMIHRKYRNTNARHRHEVDTEAHYDNMEQEDRFVRDLRGMSNRKMYGANNYRVKSEAGKSLLSNYVLDQNILTEVIGDIVLGD